MKILFLTRWYPPHGGIFITRHAKAVALYHELTVLAILPGENSSGLKPVINKTLDHEGFTVIRYFYKSSSCKIAAIASFVNLIKYLIWSFAGYRYVSIHYGPFDVIHVHILTRAAIVAFLVNLFTGKPYIISEHWTRYIPENWGFTGVFRKTLTRLIVRRASAVIAVSEFLKNAMQKCGLQNKKFIIIPNAIDTKLFTRSGKREPGQVKRIVHVSNLHERAKNIHGILRVIKILSEQRKDFEMVFIGSDGNNLYEAKNYASGLGLEPPLVTFTGRKLGAELVRMYQGSCFLLMFSNFESFSIVIYEALSCGIPVLATAVGGIPEYFSKNAGRLIPPGDEAALLENMNFMLDNYQSFDPAYLGTLIESRFGFKRVGEQFDVVYREVVET